MSTSAKNMANPLHKLPPELRQQVFKPFLRPLDMEWDGETPNLIKALRPDQKLYHEALEIFYKENMFVFHRENDWSFGDMTKEAVLSIEKVGIYVEPEIMTTGLWKVGSSVEESLTPIVSATLSDARNIREVILGFKPPSQGPIIPPFIRLQRVQMILPQPWHRRNDLDTSRAEREEMYRNGIRMVNDHLGVLGKLLTVPTLQIPERVEGRVDFEEERIVRYRREGWFWQTAEGTFLRSSKPRATATSTFDITTDLEL